MKFQTILLAGGALIGTMTTIDAAAQGIAPALAAPQAPSGGGSNDSTDTSGQDIIVSAPIRQSEIDVLSGTSVVSGTELTRDLKPTIGETLAKQPGVSATSFGPNASRPILRGFQGDRIRVLTDGIGSIDVSNTSVDHAVIIDPLLADRVEVLRGPAALLYGSSAVGGVVNVIDKRIPRSRAAKGYALDAIGTYGSAADERTIGAAADVAASGTIVLHADGSYLKSGDLRIPGFALTPERRAEALASVVLPQAGPDPIDFAGNAAIRDRLPNTAGETWTAGVGAALITDTGNLGIAYSHYNSFYGVPIRYATLPGQGEDAPRLDIVQNRLDLRGEVKTGGAVLDRIRLRVGAAQYRQFERAPDGSITTSFYNRGLEGRLELLQAKRGGWQGASGVQFSNREFDVVGDEAFLPRNLTSQTGIFTLQQFEVGRIKAEAGLRYEFTDVSAKAVTGAARFFAGKRYFGALSGSVGASYALNDAFRLGLNLSHTERTPSAEELFANGPHAGTQAYELGDPNFRIEKSWGLEATLHGHGEGYSIDASAYYNWFSNYISDNQVAQSVCEAAAAPSGRIVDLPCFQSTQGDARYYGFEGDVSVHLKRLGSYLIVADALGDYVHATIVDRGPVPRIPAPRILGGLEAQGDRLNGRIEVEHVFDQNRIAGFETPTRDYTLVNASVVVTPFPDNKRTTVTLSANNLFDAEARRASSFLKDFAPLAGRDVRVTVRVAL